MFMSYSSLPRLLCYAFFVRHPVYIANLEYAKENTYLLQKLQLNR